MRKPGCVAPVIYFRYPNGHLTLAPFSDCPAPDGAIKEEADTLAKIDDLVNILRRQEWENNQAELRNDMQLFAAKIKEIRDRIYARISSNVTTEYEKQFLRYYLELSDDRKRKLYQQRYLEAQWYLHARENDLGDRPADKEQVNLDKVNF